MTKKTEKTDKAIHSAADKIKADLNIGTDVQVPTGEEPNPIPKANPFDARKAMFAKANAIADAASQGFEEGKAHAPKTMKPDFGNETNVHADNLTPEQIEAARREAAGQLRDPSQVPVAKTNEYVTVQTTSGPIQVLQSDLDRAGGPELYLAQRVIDNSRAALQAEQERFRQQQVEWEQRQRQAAEQGVPANTSRSQGEGSQVTGGGDEEEAERLASQIYSGDPEDAKRAIRSILGRIRERSVGDIGELRTGKGQTTPAQPDPVMTAVNNAINEITARDYPDVCGDAVARAASYEKFKQMASDPRNKDRRAVDIARDACEWGRMQFMNPRKDIAESKRGLPPAGNATSAASVTETDEEPAKPAEVVAMMQDYRNFGRRVKNQ